MTPPSSRVSSRLPLGGVAGAIACRFLGAGQQDERTEGQEPEAIPYEAGPEAISPSSAAAISLRQDRCEGSAQAALAAMNRPPQLPRQAVLMVNIVEGLSEDRGAGR